MPITLRTDKIEPTAAAMLFLKRKSSLYLPKLESCQFVALIAAAMVSAQDIEGFLIATFGNKPSYVISISGGVADFLEPTKSMPLISARERFE
jgi:predicted GNAT superfamily acetyltransferase